MHNILASSTRDQVIARSEVEAVAAELKEREPSFTDEVFVLPPRAHMVQSDVVQTFHLARVEEESDVLRSGPCGDILGSVRLLRELL